MFSPRVLFVALRNNDMAIGAFFDEAKAHERVQEFLNRLVGQNWTEVRPNHWTNDLNDETYSIVAFEEMPPLE